MLPVAAMLVGTTVLTGCDDFLTTPSKSSLSGDNAYNTPAQIDQDLVGVYGALKPFSTYYFAMSEFRSDNMFLTTEAKTNQYSDCSQFNSTGLLTDDIVESCWSDHYTLIAAANTLLDRLPDADITDSYATEVEAETRFLRALSYFDLVRFFGRIPVSLHELSPDEAFALKQSEAIDVYNQAIIPDLEYAIENLKDVAFDYLGNEVKERATRTAAQALLGKVYMQLAGWPFNLDTKDKAKALFAEVLKRQDNYFVETIDEWNMMWTHEEDNKHFIFEIQYIAEKDQGNPAAALSRISNTYADEYCGAYKTVGPHAYVERDLQDHFLEMNTTEDEADTDASASASLDNYADKRLRGTINTGQSYDEETGTFIGGAQDANNFCTKFFENKIKRASLGLSDMDATIIDRTYWPQNWPILRVEDIMLLYAECVGATTEGYNMLNKIRERAGLNPLKGLSEESFQNAVKMERRYELLGEGHRWFDEIRQNTFVNDIRTKMTNYRDKHDATHSATYTIYANRVTQNSHLYPIPLSQMEVHKGLYEQNSGY